MLPLHAGAAKLAVGTGRRARRVDEELARLHADAETVLTARVLEAGVAARIGIGEIGILRGDAVIEINAAGEAQVRAQWQIEGEARAEIEDAAALLARIAGERETSPPSAGAAT